MFYVLETVYTVDYIHSSGKDTSMTASQNIERVFTIPLEVNTTNLLTVINITLLKISRFKYNLGGIRLD